MTPRPTVKLVDVHVWRYGTELWTEVEFEGEHTHALKVIYGRPTVDSSVLAATFRIDNGLRTMGIDPATNPPLVFHLHRDGKPRPHLAEQVRGTGGEFDEQGVVAFFGGACPVQGRGTIDGHSFYYKARCRGWELDVFARDAVVDFDDDDWPDPIFSYRERPYAHPDGGWLEASESRRNIFRAAEAFRARPKEEIPCSTI